MEINYQKKDITWCLDRDGPRICLRATVSNDEIQSIIINSDDFSLELDNSEIQPFIDLLTRLTEPSLEEIIPSSIFDEKVITSVEDILPDTEDDYDEEIISELIDVDEPAIVEEIPSDIVEELRDIIPEFVDESDIEVITPEVEDVRQDFSTETKDSQIVDEIIPEVEKVFQEDITYKSIDDMIPERIKEDTIDIQEDKTFIQDKSKISDIPDPSELIEFLKQTEESFAETDTSPPIEEETPGEETPVSTDEKLLGVRDEPFQIPPSIPSFETVDTASFFKKSVEKSPLEQMLEDEEISPKADEFIKTPVDKEPFSEEQPESQESPIKVFSPDEVSSTDSFISQFDQPEKVDLEELVDEFKTEVTPQDTAGISQEKEFLTEQERKAKIEKERAERKRRLWELTRGF